MKEIAVKYFLSGYSCSESVVQAAVDKGYISQDLLSVATSFSGGMGVRCLCGAVAGAQIVIGAMFGKSKTSDGMKARALAKQFNETFAQKYKVNCCKVLSAGFKDFHSPERKQHCTSMVNDSCEILEEILKAEKKINV
ncbi:C_GCAxxG_C_C family protein [bacterium]|nr:C_GCAxxG_C_C family protein [bacterium]